MCWNTPPCQLCDFTVPKFTCGRQFEDYTWEQLGSLRAQVGTGRSCVRSRVLCAAHVLQPARRFTGSAGVVG